MITNASPTQNLASQLPAANGLALVRLTIGAMFVWVFFENLGKGLYSPAGYANLINYYIKASHSPVVWKAVMGSAASHAAIAAPMQALTEISLGILLVIGLLPRPAAFVAFLYLGSLWICHHRGRAAGCARGGTGRSSVGRRRLVGAAMAVLPMVVISMLVI